MTIEMRDGKVFAVIGGEVTEIGHVETITIAIPDEPAIVFDRPVVNRALVLTAITREFARRAVKALLPRILAQMEVGAPVSRYSPITDVAPSATDGRARRGKGARRRERWRRW